MRAEFKVNIKQSKSPHKKRDRNKIVKEPPLRQYLVFAYQAKKVLESQEYRSLKEIAKWLGYTPARMTQIMNLLFLSPFIQEEILLSSKPYIHHLTITDTQKITQEVLWEKQKEIWLKLISMH
jgi:hypothetical protein